MNNLNLMTLCSLIRKRANAVSEAFAEDSTEEQRHAAKLSVDMLTQQIEDFACAIEGDNVKRVIQ